MSLLPGPRASKTRHKPQTNKRLSAPPSQLGASSPLVKAQSQDANLHKQHKQHKQGDLLDIFGDFKSNNENENDNENDNENPFSNLGNNNSKPQFGVSSSNPFSKSSDKSNTRMFEAQNINPSNKNNSNDVVSDLKPMQHSQSADPFSLFNDDFFGNKAANNKKKNNSQIAPALIQHSKMDTHDAADTLFDPAMWNTNDENNINNSNKNENDEKMNVASSHSDNSKNNKKRKSASKKRKSTSKSSQNDNSNNNNSNNNSNNNNSNNNNQASKINNNNNKKGTNALIELHRGSALLKYPRRSGFPHFKHIQLSKDNSRIQWYSKRKSLDETCILIKDIREVVKGQKTEVFKKFQQKTLEKSSFSIVYGMDYKTLDVAAKSIDECVMWVKAITHLYKLARNNGKLSDCKELFVGIHFKDRNRPKSRQGSGNFVRANNSKQLKIDPESLKEIEKDMETLHKNFDKATLLSQKAVIQKSDEYANIQMVLSEIEERMEELTQEVTNIRDTELAKREVWRANVDLNAMLEKIEVLSKLLDRRKSNLF